MESSFILPRQEGGSYYLSYSQIAVWKKSRRDYIRQYFFGEKDNKDMLIPYGDFGHKVGEALEFNDFTKFDKKETKFLKTVPRYDEFEREIRLEFKNFFIKGFIDTNSNEKGIITKVADYKTGDIEKRTPEYESKEYLQTDIYAAAIFQETGHLPLDTKVILIQRDGNAFKKEELTLGSEFSVIKKPMSKKRVKEVMAEIEAIAKDISDHYKVFLELNK
jgi:hypothetical protein